ncbi:LPD29 domain-containing protein [Stenotrophomonas sp. STK17_22]|uniref:LPD29 domain-containing protein n=1 Tax=Stenotrophomonas sp. STK17_22 TaxID=3455201 RepID=UPI003F7E769F
MHDFLPTAAVIKVGQVIYTNLYSRGYGVVVATKGKQSCEPGATPQDRATFDIVFRSTGQQSKQLPESILRGVQWKVFSEVATAAEVQALVFQAEQYAEQQAYDAASEQARHALAVAQLRVDPAYEYLEQTAEAGCHSKLAVRNIRKALKAAFPKVKFSVRSDYSAARVRWTDGPTVAAVDDVVKRFKAGNFDGMTDCYEYSRSPFGDVFGSIQYTFTSREYSDSLIQHAIHQAFIRHAEDLAGVDSASVADFRNGRLSRIYVELPRAADLQQLVWQLLGLSQVNAIGVVTTA